MHGPTAFLTFRKSADFNFTGDCVCRPSFLFKIHLFYTLNLQLCCNPMAKMHTCHQKSSEMGKKGDTSSEKIKSRKRTYLVTERSRKASYKLGRELGGKTNEYCCTVLINDLD